MTLAQGFFTRIAIMLTEAEVYEVLRGRYDREIPVNIVDLGLVYGVTLEGGVVDVRMKLTVPGCSMGRMWSTTRS